jgi:Protein of unknown function (DUF2778)
MSKGVGARLDWFGDDRETRILILWLAFGVFAAAAVGLAVAIVLLSGPAANPTVVAALPRLDAQLPPLPVTLSNPSGDAAEALPPSPFAPPAHLDIEREPGTAPVPPIPARPAPVITLRPPKPNFSESTPLPPIRPAGVGPPIRPVLGLPSSSALARAAGADRRTAVYDISARAVYLPDGTRLEAHSGLGDLLDDPRYVGEADRGATPPHLYELTLRESLFHGVQALRLNPIGDGDMFGRNGLLAHPYMLGPRGDSNGCVSFKDYDAFLRAFENGQVKWLAVVARMD